MLFHAYLLVMNKAASARKVFLGTAIISTLIYLYGVLLHRVGIPTADTGFGAWLVFLMLVAMYFLHFGNKIVVGMVVKYAKIPDATVSEPESVSDDLPPVEGSIREISEPEPAPIEPEPVFEMASPVAEVVAEAAPEAPTAEVETPEPPAVPEVESQPEPAPETEKIE